MDADRIEPLRTGQITFAEFHRREDKRREDAKAAYKRATGFRAEIGRWLVGLPSDIRFAGLWPEFTRNVLAIADRVDEGSLSRPDGSRMIEERRQRYNADLALATQVTLNCSYNGSNGQRRDIPTVIDYRTRQVNGYAAEMSDTAIQWSYPSSDGKFTYNAALNRLSGFASIGTTEFPSLMTGQCTTAQRQF